MISDSLAPAITVVVPTYNERENLPVLAERLFDLGIEGLRLLVVDDGSPDGTGDVADKLAAEGRGQIAVIHRSTKDGLGRAYVAGMSQALSEGADIVVQMDADLSHPAESLPELLAPIVQNEADFVIGSRYVPGGQLDTAWPWHRRALSKWANVYVNTLLRLGVSDVTAGFKAWSADALRLVDLQDIKSNGYSFQVEMNHRALSRGCQVREVPITFTERVDGESKLTLGVQAESALTPWRLLLRR
ncbi:polyprenol monophosphomannose synthase [Streptomyces kanamyceticus]|uniref:Polyprenol monophosphomannose synthase n=1 Tax=Streptomyces kanamyceticus TaxID=1967 RepID=A0A5J6GVI9_STRKN|nr:polyprenol monophosphomannose synthase [Streptomyces kanamyceticus]QEU97945.1 polyprenol monophosphomannose synthase [Streptomyces kanamyceticus]